MDSRFYFNQHGFRSGRVCVLDCAAQALQTLYNSEFMPYVVVIAPPPLEELKQMCKLRGDKCKKTESELRATCDQHAALMKSEFARYFDLVLVVSSHNFTQNFHLQQNLITRIKKPI
jgi:guanylate kinase